MKRHKTMRIIHLILAIHITAANSHAYIRGMSMVTPSTQWREALPSAWKNGEFHGMLTRAGVKTSARWDMTKNELKLSLVAERDAE